MAQSLTKRSKEGLLKKPDGSNPLLLVNDRYFALTSAKASFASDRNFRTFSRLLRPLESSTPGYGLHSVAFRKRHGLPVRLRGIEKDIGAFGSCGEGLIKSVGDISILGEERADFEAGTAGPQHSVTLDLAIDDVGERRSLGLIDPQS